MALWANSRILNFVLAITISGSILLAACNGGTHIPSVLGTPIATTSSIITNENMDKLTELAHWPVNGWVKCCLIFSPDSQLLALAFDNTDTTIQLRNVATGYIVGTLNGLTSRVDDLAFSPDGKTLAASSYDKTVRIWNVKNSQEVQTFSFPDAAFGIAFSPDGKLLAVGMRNGTVQLLDTDSGQVFQTFSGHTDLVNSVVFSPDGTKLASGSFDGMIKLWDVAGGEEIQHFKGHSNSVWKVSISPDGKTLASASTDGTVRLWNATTGQEMLVLKDKTVLEWFDVEFSVDGKYLAAASQHTLVIWDVANGRNLRTTDSPETGIDTLSFSPDGMLLAMGGDGFVRLWGVP